MVFDRIRAGVVGFRLANPFRLICARVEIDQPYAIFSVSCALAQDPAVAGPQDILLRDRSEFEACKYRDELIGLEGLPQHRSVGKPLSQIVAGVAGRIDKRYSAR